MRKTNKKAVCSHKYEKNTAIESDDDFLRENVLVLSEQDFRVVEELLNSEMSEEERQGRERLERMARQFELEQLPELDISLEGKKRMVKLLQQPNQEQKLKKLMADYEELKKKLHVESVVEG